MKKIICLILVFVLVVFSIPVSVAETRSAPVSYSASNVSHRFNTGSKTNTIYSRAIETPANIVYINSNNPSQYHSSYHYVKFINQDGDAVGGGYQPVYAGGTGYVSFSSSSVTSLYAMIKNIYYKTSESYYKMTTSGIFNLSIS